MKNDDLSKEFAAIAKPNDSQVAAFLASQSLSQRIGEYQRKAGRTGSGQGGSEADTQKSAQTDPQDRDMQSTAPSATDASGTVVQSPSPLVKPLKTPVKKGELNKTLNS